MIYDPLPRKLKAIRAIMAQPYYGIDGRDFAIDYVYSHDFWVVGTRQEIFNTRARCAEEVGQMEHRGRVLAGILLPLFLVANVEVSRA